MNWPEGERLIVCGGRDYGHAKSTKREDVVQAELERKTIWEELSAWKKDRNVSIVAVGGATGVDAAALDWARFSHLPVLILDANWTGLVRKAGPVRNSALVKLIQPTSCIAIAGGDGTADMARKCERAGAKVWRIEP